MTLDTITQRIRLRRLVAAFALAGLLAAPGTVSAQDSSAAESESTEPRAASTKLKKLSTPELIDRLMSGTAFVNCPQVGTGTCWLVDLKQRLVITNQHVINKAKTIQVYFPVKKDGEWVTDPAHYLRQVKPSVGTVILSDVRSDLALIQLDRIPAGFRAFRLAKRSPRQGSSLHTIGGKPLGSDTMWVYTFGRVRQVGKGKTALGYVTRIVQAQMEYNKGNSGGPIINDSGELVAVVEGYRRSARNGAQLTEVRNVSMAIDVKQVRAFLKEGNELVEPKTAQLLVKRGKRHSSEGRYNQAIRDFSNAIRQDKTLAIAYTSRGWTFHLKGDSQTAIVDYDEALKIDGSLIEAHYGRGMINRTLGKTKEALADFTNAIRFDPESHRSYNQRGITYFRARQYKSAYTDFKRAAKLKPTDFQLHANRALAAERFGDYATAITAYQESLRLNPRNPGNVNHLGICYFRQKKYEKAAETFQAAIKLASNRPIYYVNLGDALHRLGKDEPAISAFSTAIRIRKSYLAYYSRGVSFAAMKKQNEAIADFTDAIRLNPKYASAYFRRALSYRAMGNKAKAQADFAQAAKLDPKAYKSYADVSSVEPKRKPVAARPSVVGTWLCVGTINGVKVRIRSTMTAGGEYTTTANYQQPNTQPVTESERGTWSIKGETITISPDNDTPVTRRFGFKNGQLWLHMQEHKLTLYFTKQ